MTASTPHPSWLTSGRIGVFATDSDLSEAERLGRSDYSYHFVKRYFSRALADLVPVTEVGSVAELAEPGRLDLLFLPPHRVPPVADPGWAAVDVFAWEFDTIPTDVWNDDDRNDWRVPLSRVRGAIVHSQYALDAVARAMPPGYPICSAPAPVWDDFAPLTRLSLPDSWVIRFRGWVLDSWRVGLDHSHVMVAANAQVADREVELSGPVYTTIVNPDDSRKNWVDAFSAFAEAFRDDPDVTLVIKLVHHDAQRAFDIVADMMFRPAPFRCRVVVVYGYLDDDSYRSLVAGTSFIVNTSRGEGQCLPLMEFMSAGVPAIAPDHTAMAQYINADNAFIVGSSRNWTHWPHDPRLMLRCLGHTVDWQSLHDAYLASRELLLRSESAHRQMGTAATQALELFASRARFRRTMSDFLPLVGGPDLTGSGPS